MTSCKGKKNNNYKDGRRSVKHFCKCGDEIHYTTWLRGKKQCKSCSNKINPRKKKVLREYRCRDCNEIIARTTFDYGEGFCNHCSRKGKRNYRYSGLTPLNSRVRNSFKYRQWRSDVFTRDNYTCQICNKRGGHLQAHHTPKTFAAIIEEYKIKTLQDALNCEELWNINNGTTLCVKCHESVR